MRENENPNLEHWYKENEPEKYKEYEKEMEERSKHYEKELEEQEKEYQLSDQRTEDCPHCDEGVVHNQVDDMFGNFKEFDEGCEFCNGEGEITYEMEECGRCHKPSWMLKDVRVCDDCFEEDVEELAKELRLDED